MLKKRPLLSRDLGTVPVRLKRWEEKALIPDGRHEGFFLLNPKWRQLIQFFPADRATGRGAPPFPSLSPDRALACSRANGTSSPTSAPRGSCSTCRGSC